jgi:uncharacterized membrane protein
LLYFLVVSMNNYGAVPSILSVMLPIHVVAGGAAIILGAVALLAPKGGTLHRRGGLLFVCAMVAMGCSGSLLALRQSLTNPNALGGMMSVYFVTTALTTVRPSSQWTRRVTVLAMIVGTGVALAWFRLGVRGMISRPPDVDPAMIYSTFVFGAAMALGVLGDRRIIRIEAVGLARLRRHLWRMCMGLLIALASFFAIPERVARILPSPFTSPLMRSLPILLVLGAMCYWLWKVRKRRMPIPPSRAVSVSSA